jgi:hypothetical protein
MVTRSVGVLRALMVRTLCGLCASLCRYLVRLTCG